MMASPMIAPLVALKGVTIFALPSAIASQRSQAGAAVRLNYSEASQHSYNTYP